MIGPVRKSGKCRKARVICGSEKFSPITIAPNPRSGWSAPENPADTIISGRLFSIIRFMAAALRSPVTPRVQMETQSRRPWMARNPALSNSRANTVAIMARKSLPGVANSSLQPAQGRHAKRASRKRKTGVFGKIARGRASPMSTGRPMRQERWRSFE